MTEQLENLDSQNEAGEVETPEENSTTDDSTELSEREKQFLARAKKAEAKLKELKTSKVEAPAQPKQPKIDLDYAQKTFIANVLKVDLKDNFEMKIVKEYLDNGKTLDDLLENKYFLNDLKEYRDEKATEAAIPSIARRMRPSSRQTVEYWLAKGEMPPHSDQILRRQVLNARIELEKQKSQFSDNPVITH